jgi:L-fuconolactonase
VAAQPGLADMPAVDAHIHLWRLDETGFTIPPVMTGDLVRDYQAPDLAAVLDPAGIGRAVAITAGRNLAHTVALVGIGRATGRLLAVVGWFDLHDPDGLARWFAEEPATADVAGVRLVVAADEVGHYLEDDAGTRAMRTLVDLDRIFEVMPLGTADISRAAAIARQFPSLRVVVDHLGKPIGGPSDEQWRAAIDDIALLPNVYLKVSGWTTPVRAEWSGEELRPYLGYVVSRMPASRLFYGSNWPVTLVAGDYARMWEETNRAMDQLTPADRDAIVRTTVHQVYRQQITRVPAHSGGTS